jgi:hypothetical protein
MTLFCLSSRKAKKYPVYHVNPVKGFVVPRIINNDLEIPERHSDARKELENESGSDDLPWWISSVGPYR